MCMVSWNLKVETTFPRNSHLDTECFQEFLNDFSGAYPKIYISFSWITLPKLKAPENIILLFQPAHCPELNPIERLWEHLKDCFWQLFNNLDALKVTTVRNSTHGVQNLEKFDRLGLYSSCFICSRYLTKYIVVMERIRPDLAWESKEDVVMQPDPLALPTAWVTTVESQSKECQQLMRVFCGGKHVPMEF